MSDTRTINVYKAKFLARFKRDIIAYKKDERTWLRLSFIDITRAYEWMKGVNENPSADYEVLEVILDTVPCQSFTIDT